MTGRFTSIVTGGGGNLDDIFSGWDAVEAADDFGSPIPPGKYSCIWRKGELTASRKGTPSYKLTLEIEDGEHAGRKLWHDIWLSHAAAAIAKRDLAKLGITNPRVQLAQPIPQWLRLNVQVGIHTDDSGVQRNTVVRFEVVGKIEPARDEFAPTEPPVSDSGIPTDPFTERGV